MQDDRTEYAAAVRHVEHPGWPENFEQLILHALADGVPEEDIKGWVEGFLAEMSMSKHDAACILRREEAPYLCTCGLSDEEVAAGSVASDEEQDSRG